MTGMGWELGRSKLRWAPLFGGAVAAAVHGRDPSAPPDSWLLLAQEAELVATIVSPVLLLVAAGEAQRPRRARVSIAERTAVRSLASIRAVQAGAIVLWALLTALVALGVGMLAASGPHGLRDVLVVTPVPLIGPVVAAVLGVAIGTIVPTVAGLGIAFVAAAGLVLAPILLGQQWWLLFTPLGSSLEAGVAMQGGIAAARSLIALGSILLLAALIVLALQPSGTEVIVAVLLMLLAAGFAYAGILWLLELAPQLDLPGVPQATRPVPTVSV